MGSRVERLTVWVGFLGSKKRVSRMLGHTPLGHMRVTEIASSPKWKERRPLVTPQRRGKTEYVSDSRKVCSNTQMRVSRITSYASCGGQFRVRPSNKTQVPHVPLRRDPYQRQYLHFAEICSDSEEKRLASSPRMLSWRPLLAQAAILGTRVYPLEKTLKGKNCLHIVEICI